MSTNNDSKYAYGVISSQSLHTDQVDHLLYTTGSDITALQAEVERLVSLCRDNDIVLPESALKTLPGGLYGSEETECMIEDYNCTIDALVMILEEADVSIPEEDLFFDEPITVGTCEGVTYQTCWLGGALHFFILRSPVVQKVKTCSPCFPGAGDLDNIKSLPVEASPELEGDFTVGYVPYADCTAYAVPADWRGAILNF